MPPTEGPPGKTVTRRGRTSGHFPKGLQSTRVGPPGVLTRAPGLRGQELSKSAPRALSEEQQCRLLQLAERASARDRAIVVVLLYTGLRLAELVALDVDDVRGVGAQGLVVPASTLEARKRCLRRRRQTAFDRGMLKLSQR